MTTRALPTVVLFDKRRGFGRALALPGSPSGEAKRHRLSSSTWASSPAPLVSPWPVGPGISPNLGCIGQAHAPTMRFSRRRGIGLAFSSLRGQRGILFRWASWHHYGNSLPFCRELPVRMGRHKSHQQFEGSQSFVRGGVNGIRRSIGNADGRSRPFWRRGTVSATRHILAKEAAGGEFC
jgi:hypothetical protein